MGKFSALRSLNTSGRLWSLPGSMTITGIAPRMLAVHTVVVLYGINAPGTLASGVYFDNFVITNLANYPAGAYIVHWQGTQPNVPFSTDTYKIVYHT
jgi:hypothetical protein